MVRKRKNNNPSDEFDIVKLVMDRLIKDYGYSRDEIDLEGMLPGKSRRRADLIVFDSSEKKVPFIIFEVKKDIRYSLDVDEVISYLKDAKAKYAVLTDGKEKICYMLVDSVAFEVPDIPRKNEKVTAISRKQLKPARNLEYKFWKITDRMRTSSLLRLNM